jgi:hypothetical protein
MSESSKVGDVLAILGVEIICNDTPADARRELQSQIVELIEAMEVFYESKY